MMKLAEEMWKNCLDTKTRMKFEGLRTKHHAEIQDLLDEINTERTYRKEQCRKVFDHWHENIKLECKMEASVKLPTWCLKDVKGLEYLRTKEPADVQVTSRDRNL